MKKKISIIGEYYECGDGCCSEYYYTIEIDGVELPCRFHDDGEAQIEAVLKHLGIEAEIEQIDRESHDLQT